MAVIDPTKPVDRVRLEIGDTGDLPRLDNNTIQYYLDKYNGNERLTVIQCANIILVQLAQEAGYNKADVIIQDGKNVYKAYADYLKSLIDPRNSTMVVTVYAGGVSKQDMRNNDNNSDNATRPTIKERDKPLSF